MKRRTMLSMLPAASMFAPAAKPPQPQNDFKGVVNAGDYPSLQAAANVAFGPVESPHGTANVLSNKVLYIPNGVYTPPFSGAPVLDLRYLHGGHIVGSGRDTTRLRQNVAGVPVIRTNGCGYSHFGGFLLEGSPESTILDLNWDGTAGGPALQSNSFEDVSFLNGNNGIDIGRSGFMGSENSFLNCYWQSQTNAGFRTLNANALQQTILGGNFQNCARGIWVQAGSVPVVNGTGFQLSQYADIQIEQTPSNKMSVVGCRTESLNFIINNGGHGMHVSACTQRSNGAGYFFAATGGQHVLSACETTDGNILAKYWAQIRIENSGFIREDWLESYQPWFFPNNSRSSCVEVENLTYGWPQKEIRRRRYESTDGLSFNKVSEYLVQVL